MSGAASSAFELLAQLDAHAQGLVYDTLQLDDVKALRLACRAACSWVARAVRRIYIDFGEKQARSGEALDQLCALLSALPTRWPRCNTLGLTLRDRDPENSSANDARLIGTLLTQALLCKRPGAAQLTGLELDVDFASCASHVDLGLLCSLAVACPALHTLALEGDCGLSCDDSSLQEAALQALSRLPRLSDLTLPGPAGLQHVGLLAGQLTRLVLTSDEDEKALSDDSVQWSAKLTPLASLTRLVELKINCEEFEAFGSTEAELQLFRSLPPSLQRLTLRGLKDGHKLWDTRYTFEGGRPATVHLAVFPSRQRSRWLHRGEEDGEGDVINSTMELYRVYLRLKAAGALQEGHRMRRLSCPVLTLSEERDEDGEWYQLLSPEQERGVRELLAGCEEVRIHTLVVQPCIQAPTLQQAQELLRRLSPSPRLTLQLRSPYHISAQPADYLLGLRKPLVLPSASAGAAGAAAAANPAPAHAQGPGPAAAAAATQQPPPPPTELELLRSLVCVDGTARHVLLAGGGSAGAAMPPWTLTEEQPDSCADFIAEHTLWSKFPGAVHEYGTEQEAADVLLALQGIEFGGLPVFALPVRTKCRRPKDMTLAAAEVLRAYLEHGDVTADKVVAALEAWKRFGDVVKQVNTNEDDVDVVDDSHLAVWAEWRALCKEAVVAVTEWQRRLERLQQQ